jgi:SAM-dependent methyltransferase
MAQARQQRDWDDMGALDPLWAVLSAPEGKHGGWDEAEFFRTGQVVVEEVMAAADRLGYPAAREHALDFGCGVGRLTRALAAHFRQCTGVDISPAMIERARALNQDYPNLDFQANPNPDLRLFPAARFDLICTFRVLQHLPDRNAIEVMLAEFLRTLRPDGLLVFQLLSAIPLRRRVQLRRRLYEGLRAAGVPASVLYERLGLSPIRMRCIPEETVLAFLEGQGARVLEVQLDRPANPAISSRVYYVTK